MNELRDLNQDTEARNGPEARRQYVSPRLRVYGAIEHLTAGGSTPGAEGAAAPAFPTALP